MKLATHLHLRETFRRERNGVSTTTQTRLLVMCFLLDKHTGSFPLLELHKLRSNLQTNGFLPKVKPAGEWSRTLLHSHVFNVRCLSKIANSPSKKYRYQQYNSQPTVKTTYAAIYSLTTVGRGIMIHRSTTAITLRTTATHKGRPNN